ncbi:hypothetical protein DICPUDRAFT_80625 [Dictyostelium purpureum]|uniref:Uncharacterized protein n=1 Tax=Dictyostelium purpureum TaxID=5786 RepID=F0ZR18_DICPU|nr:uncharacterized protein DICPUDRAFT_80625 [Dictyostelium purpureum]EGC33593.1 hypothetical protein DICPUDRAFT_80625 [Dictyostelium purpureum]|eukprot:XP_003289861.1 hypothetical protein DICPUDRAFT_80625 [Dictyostelium purpureum]
MKLKVVVLIILVLLMVSFTYSFGPDCEDGDEDDCDNGLHITTSGQPDNTASSGTSGGNTTQSPSPTTSGGGNGTTNSSASTGGQSPSPSLFTSTTSFSTGGSTPSPNNSTGISDESSESVDMEGDLASKSTTIGYNKKQNEKDPFKYKSINGSYIAYAIGVVCIAFIMVVLYKKFRAGSVAPIDIDTANYSVLEMRD